MIFKALQDDLFNRALYHEGVYYVQCISADLRMGRGIATQFNDHFDMKRKLIKAYPNYIQRFDSSYCFVNGEEIHDADVLYVPGTPVFNLVTKRNYWDKPTLQSLDHSLMILLDMLLRSFPDDVELLMPKIGCGLDRLNWKFVRHIIFKRFYGSDINITICKLKENVK